MPWTLDALKADTQEAREVRGVLSQLGTMILFESMHPVIEYFGINYTVFSYLRMAIRIMSFCDSLPHFIDDITYVIDKGLAKV